MEPRAKDRSFVNPFAAPEVEADLAPIPTRISEMVLAERGTRLSGAILDNILYGLSLLPVVAALFIEDDSPLLVLAFIPLLGLFVYQTWLISTTGQSLAKKWLKMRIVKTDGSPVGFVNGVLLRSWVLAALGATGLGSIIGLIDALMIFGDERQCLHDKIASTKVIDVSNMG